MITHAFLGHYAECGKYWGRECSCSMSRTFLEYLNITSTANDNNSDNSNNNNKANNVNGNSDNNINNNDDDDNNDNTKIIISLILLIIYDIIKYSPMVIRFQAI